MGCSPSPVTYNVLIDGLCKNGDLTRVTKLVDNMFLKGCSPNEVTYLIRLFMVYVLRVNWIKLLVSWNVWFRANVSQMMSHMGHSLTGWLKQRRATDAAQLVISMEERRYCLNQHIYSVLISGLFKEGKAEGAMSLWKKMAEKGCQPNIVVYSALIDGLCRDGKPDEAKEILSGMISNGCLPNAYTYSSVMKGFFKTGLSEEAVQVWRDMDKTGCAQNEYCYSVFIDGLCGVGKVKKAMMVWSKMLTIGIKPDTVAYTKKRRITAQTMCNLENYSLHNRPVTDTAQRNPPLNNYNPHICSVSP